MKAYKAIYEQGHFIDTETRQIINFIRGAEYVISGNNSAFNENSGTQNALISLNSNDKWKWAEGKFGTARHI